MAPIVRRGMMLVLSSPSGAGKTSIALEMLCRDQQLILSVSVTTRPPRPAEQEGRDYYFVSKDAFDRMVNAGKFLEHARVFDHDYGTPKAPVEMALAAGKDVLFDVDWQGTQQIAQNAHQDLVRVFILPPSTVELERRLRTRGQDTNDVVQGRMARAAQEMSHWPEYDYIVINHDFESSVDQVMAILNAERLRRERQTGLSNFVHDLMGV
ncbi:MAG: guanylate kinase [Rhodospirillales bacterium]